jgi:hypothetical protein
MKQYAATAIDNSDRLAKGLTCESFLFLHPLLALLLERTVKAVKDVPPLAFSHRGLGRGAGAYPSPPRRSGQLLRVGRV